MGSVVVVKTQHTLFFGRFVVEAEINNLESTSEKWHFVQRWLNVCAARSPELQKLQPRCLVRSVLMPAERLVQRAASSLQLHLYFYMVTVMINNKWMSL